MLILTVAIGLAACSDEPFSAGNDEVFSPPTDKAITASLKTVFEGELGIEPAIELRSDQKSIEFGSESDLYIPATTGKNARGAISLKGSQLVSSHFGDSQTSELSLDQKELLQTMKNNSEQLERESKNLSEISAQEWKKGLMSSKGDLRDLGEGRIEMVRESRNLAGQTIKSVLVMDEKSRGPISMSIFVDGSLFSEATRSAETGQFDFVSYEKEFDVLAPREKLSFEFGN